MMEIRGVSNCDYTFTCKTEQYARDIRMIIIIIANARD